MIDIGLRIDGKEINLSRMEGFDHVLGTICESNFDDATDQGYEPPRLGKAFSSETLTEASLPPRAPR